MTDSETRVSRNLVELIQSHLHNGRRRRRSTSTGRSRLVFTPKSFTWTSIDSSRRALSFIFSVQLNRTERSVSNSKKTSRNGRRDAAGRPFSDLPATRRFVPSPPTQNQSCRSDPGLSNATKQVAIPAEFRPLPATQSASNNFE